MLPDAPLATEPDVLEAWESELRDLVRDTFRPAPHLTQSEWADAYGYLAQPRGQRWDTSVTPYLREIMDSVSDRTVREVVVMKAARVGYTQGVIGQRIGYVIDQDPAPILVIHPTDTDAKDWSRKELDSMLESSERLSDRVAEKRSRESGNTLLEKDFDGGSITIRGAHSPAKLRRHTARDVIFDEVDGFVYEAGSEGDPIMLGQRANRTYPDRKTIMGSTPGLRETSRILRALEASDYREYHVPCPHCDELQVLEWGGPDEVHGLKWAKEVSCQGCGTVDGETDEEGRCEACGSEAFDVEHLPETTHYVCRHCHGMIDEHSKHDIMTEAQWIPRFPGRRTRGYHIPGLLSLFEGASWENLVRQFLKSKNDRAMLQVWTNQWLGEPFEERGERVESGDLEARATPFLSDSGEPVEVPDGVAILTAGVDVQGDWLELLVRGWGGSRRSWDIFHQRIYGDPHRLDDTWARLDALLGREFTHASGRTLTISATMIDSGGSEGMTKATYAFVSRRQHRSIWASKGDRGHPDHPPYKRSTRKTNDGVKLFTIGTYVLKADLMWRLRVGNPELPGYIHFRTYDPALCNGFDAEYFKQFEAEELKVVRNKNTHAPQRRWVQVRRRNEAIDLHVLADAALQAKLSPAARENLGKKAKRLSEPKSEDEDGSGSDGARRPRPPKKNWATGWKR